MAFTPDNNWLLKFSASGAVRVQVVTVFRSVLVPFLWYSVVESSFVTVIVTFGFSSVIVTFGCSSFVNKLYKLPISCSWFGEVSICRCLNVLLKSSNNNLSKPPRLEAA